MVEYTSTVKALNGSGQLNAKLVYPDNCPVCNVALHPQFVGAQVVGMAQGQAVFRCVTSACGRYFLTEYTWASGVAHEWQLISCYPKTQVARAFSDDIKNLSPDFVAIYGDSVGAETAGLHHLVGVGLRKALEFLIKDFCVSASPSNASSLKAKFLGNVIKDDVTDPKVKACAERAVWLGNDETHYERRWQGKDVKDLKILIELTLHWIESEILTAKFEAEMPAGGKS